MKFVFILLSLLTPLLAFEEREFSITGLRCQSLNCETREGIMPHRLTTVEISGTAKDAAGYSLLFRVVNQKDRSVALERKVGVFANGGFTASIPAYTLADGVYLFGFSTLAQPQKAIAAGTFTVAPAGAAGAGTPSHEVSGSGLAGHWYGIAGTAANLELKADGTYISGGSARGTWRQEGKNVTFTGPLAAWNGGRGTLSAKANATVIEFYWTNAQGAKQYFVIGKY